MVERSPRRDEVWLVSLDPTQGVEIQKTRPCLVISPDEMNQHLRSVIIAPMRVGIVGRLLGESRRGGEQKNYQNPKNHHSNHILLRSVLNTPLYGVLRNVYRYATMSRLSCSVTPISGITVCASTCRGC